MGKTFDANDILDITDDLQDQIEDLECKVDRCCSKSPINCGNGITLYKGYNCGHWQFKSLIAGDNITITENECEITISSTGGGGGSFTCSDLNSCTTTNLPEGSNLYFTNERAQDAVGNILTNSPQITFTYNDGTPSISAAFASNNISQFTNNAGYITCSDVNSCITGTQNQVLYYNSSGNLTSSQYFTREPNGDTQIIGDSAGQDGGYLGLNQLGKSYFGVYSAGVLYNHFWADVTGTGWNWNGNNFMLPLNDGNPNYVMITDGSGVLSFVDVNTLVTGGSGTVTSVELSAGTGISLSGTNPITTSGTITVTNSAPDQVVSLTQGGTTTITGTYPNFIISSADQYTGTVTSVGLVTGTTGTDVNVGGSPVTSSGNITLNIPTASGSNRGALSSTDWTTFNNKAASGVNTDITSLNSPALGSATATTQSISDNSTKVATTAFVNSFFNADNFRRVYSDLTGFGTAISANTDIGTDFRITVGNTGSTARDTASYSNALGVLNFLTNTNAGGRVCMYSFGWYLGSKVTSHKSKLKIPVLATNAQNFYSGIGLVDNTQFSATTNGVMVYCVNGVNSGNWVIQTMTSSVSTTFNTSVTPVADTFTTIEIQINAAGNQVRVFFDGVEPSGIGYPITTNIPAASATQLFGAVCIEKSNGTTSRTLSVDYIDSKQY